MQRIAEGFIGKTLSEALPGKIETGKDIVFISALICKNLADMSETCESMIERMGEMDDLPSLSTLGMISNSLNMYCDSEIIVDGEPNWDGISRLSREKRETVCRLYKMIKRNITDQPLSEGIRKSVERRDKQFFVKHYDTLFKDVPFKETLVKFKNFLICPHVSKEDQELIWKYFDVILDIINNEKEIREDLA